MVKLHPIAALIAAARHRAATLRASVPYADDRSADIADNEADRWERLADEAEAALRSPHPHDDGAGESV